MTIVRRIAGPLGAPLRTEPTADAPIVLVAPDGTMLEGELIHGERLHGNDRYLRFTVCVWHGRTEEPRQRRRKDKRP